MKNKIKNCLKNRARKFLRYFEQWDIAKFVIFDRIILDSTLDKKETTKV